MSTPSKSKNGGGSKKPSPPSATAEKFFGSEVDIKGKFIFKKYKVSNMDFYKIITVMFYFITCHSRFLILKNLQNMTTVLLYFCSNPF